MKRQDFHSVQINASLDTLWAMLQIEIEDPARFDPQVSGLEIVEQTETTKVREISRNGIKWRESIIVDPEAWLVQHERTFSDGIAMTLIHQLSPSGGSCDLNLAANWQQPDPESDDIQTALQPLSERAESFKQLAHAIERK